MQRYFITFAFIHIVGVQSLIVPDELPTILSVIYSNIPVIKKGTDSRIGWGFRLGDRADFQVITELGPQTYTQPLANQEDKTANKRNTLDSLSNTLYAQRQREKQLKRRKQQEEKIVSDTEGGRWLESWSKSVRQEPREVQEVEPSQELPPGAQPGLGVGEIDAKSVIPDDTTLKLLELLKIYLKQRKQVREESEKVNETFVDDKTDDSQAKLSELHRERVTEERESGTESVTTQAE